MKYIESLRNFKNLYFSVIGAITGAGIAYMWGMGFKLF